MATKVYDTLVIELENGDEVTLRPLSIRNLRKFMHIINQETNIEEVETEIDAMDGFLNGAVFCLKALYPERYEALSKEEIEDLLTVPTMLKILEVVGGLKAADPNLMGAALVGMS